MTRQRSRRRLADLLRRKSRRSGLSKNGQLVSARSETRRERNLSRTAASFERDGEEVGAAEETRGSVTPQVEAQRTVESPNPAKASPPAAPVSAPRPQTFSAGRTDNLSALGARRDENGTSLVPRRPSSRICYAASRGAADCRIAESGQGIAACCSGVSSWDLLRLRCLVISRRRV
jgi:hypothetical protein